TSMSQAVSAKRLQRFNSSEFGSRSTMMRSSSMVAPSSSNGSYIMSQVVPYSSYDESADPNTPQIFPVKSRLYKSSYKSSTARGTSPAAHVYTPMKMASYFERSCTSIGSLSNSFTTISQRL